MRTGVASHLAVLLLVALLAVGVMAGTASAKNLTVEVTPDNWYVIAWMPHINSGQAHVYGPSYYRTFYFSWSVRSKTFYDAPAGSYRVRYCFSPGYDTNYYVEKNDYETIYWWESGDKASVSSP